MLPICRYPRYSTHKFSTIWSSNRLGLQVRKHKQLLSRDTIPPEWLVSISLGIPRAGNVKLERNPWPRPSSLSRSKQIQKIEADANRCKQMHVKSCEAEGIVLHSPQSNHIEPTGCRQVPQHVALHEDARYCRLPSLISQVSKKAFFRFSKWCSSLGDARQCQWLRASGT
jgi:hypothetical protein